MYESNSNPRLWWARAEAQQAHALIKAGHTRGKIVLHVGDEAR
jgi:hypothetical protein